MVYVQRDKELPEKLCISTKGSFQAMPIELGKNSISLSSKNNVKFNFGTFYSGQINYYVKILNFA